MAVASAGPYASLHLAPDRQPHQHPTAQFFTGRMPFLPPNQQRQSTEGNKDIGRVPVNVAHTTGSLLSTDLKVSSNDDRRSLCIETRSTRLLISDEYSSAVSLHKDMAKEITNIHQPSACTDRAYEIMNIYQLSACTQRGLMRL